MGKVVWHVTMSLDGFIAGPGDSMDWIFRRASAIPNPQTKHVMQSTGAALSGRRGYDLGRKPGRPPQARKLFGGAWSGPVFVLTHHPPADEDEDDPDFHFLSCDIGDAVAIALRAAEGRNLLILGADIARQCVDGALLDEILVQIAPVLLGEGVRLFGRPGPQVDLELGSVAQAGQTANLRFTIAKAPTGS